MNEILFNFPKYIILFSTISLGILIPILERKNQSLRKKVFDYEEKINAEKFNIVLDSIQKLKIKSTYETQIILKTLKSKHLKIFENAMKDILLNNLNALSKGKADIKSFSKKSDEEIINKIKEFSKNLRDKTNGMIKKEKYLREKLINLERNKFIIYISLIILQLIALILNQGVQNG